MIKCTFYYKVIFNLTFVLNTFNDFEVKYIKTKVQRSKFSNDGP